MEGSISINSKNLRCRKIHNGIPYQFIDEDDMPSDIRPVGVYNDHQIPEGYVFSSTTEHFYFYNGKLRQYRVLREQIIGRQTGDTKAVIINDVNGKSTYIQLDKYKQHLEQYEENRRRLHEQTYEEEPIELEEPIEEELIEEETIDDWLREVHEELFRKACTVKGVSYRFATAASVNSWLKQYKRNHPAFSFNGQIKDYLVGLGFQFVKTTIKHNNEIHKGVPLYRLETARFDELMNNI